MATPDSPVFPLVEMHAVATPRNEWVAVSLKVSPGCDEQTLLAVFGAPDLLAAIAPLDCVLFIEHPGVLTDALLDLLPPARVRFAVAGAALADARARQRLPDLQHRGYRMFLDGHLPDGVAAMPALHSLALDCGQAAPGAGALDTLSGPHLAYRVDDAVRFAQCVQAGFGWFSGDYPQHPAHQAGHNDGTSRKRLLTLLGLLARDAESRELEALLKQDPALCFHLFKLVNSAAFAMGTPITTFNQAINVLGRRQLQRWLQLLLYARQRDDGVTNPLLPVAALRAAQMEALCGLEGGGHDAQDEAFTVGVFSLLDVLFEMPMSEIVGALNLAPAAAAALLRREGRLGRLLLLCETPSAGPATLEMAGIAAHVRWQSQLQAYHWATHVSRNL